jgi:Succinyl-CoA synthetase, beta subunit
MGSQLYLSGRQHWLHGQRCGLGDGDHGLNQTAWRQTGQLPRCWGGTTKERVAEALKIILSDDKVKGILVNIFGGIVRCDLIAEGIIAAVQEVGIEIPIVVRLEGNNAELGSKILNESDLNIIAPSSLTDAAKKIVEAVGE